MTTIPQVARAMREILTTTAAEAGRATRFVQRTSPLNGATFSQTLVFGFLGNPQATLEELTPTAAALGIEISPQLTFRTPRMAIRLFFPGAFFPRTAPPNSVMLFSYERRAPTRHPSQLKL